MEKKNSDNQFPSRLIVLGFENVISRCGFISHLLVSITIV